jgi:hypothetical protein
MEDPYERRPIFSLTLVICLLLPVDTDQSCRLCEGTEFEGYCQVVRLLAGPEIT